MPLYQYKPLQSVQNLVLSYETPTQTQTPDTTQILILTCQLIKKMPDKVYVCIIIYDFQDIIIKGFFKISSLSRRI